MFEIVTATHGLLSVDVARAAPDLQSPSVKRTLKILQDDGLLRRDERRRSSPRRPDRLTRRQCESATPFS